jgi:hypothetical protein
MRRVFLMGLVGCLACSCVSEPKPWKPDTSVDTDSDHRVRNADGDGEVGLGDQKAPETTADVKLVDSLEVVDIVVAAEIKDAALDIAEVTEDVSSEVDTEEVCQPECTDKECGDDGCGSTCGKCDDDLDCTGDSCNGSHCIFEVNAFSCVIEQTCIPAGTENPKDVCQKCQPDAGDFAWSSKEDGISCGKNAECSGGNCLCTDQKCGEVCCQPGEECDGIACCAPQCDGMDCGPNGCGGSCGGCPDSQDICVESQCVCQPACDAMECGGDGCDGVCGECVGPQDECIDGSCVCQPDCQDKDCGDDGCGGICGKCEIGQFCINGQCPPAGMECDDGNWDQWDGCTDGKVSEFLLEANGKSPQIAPHGDHGFVLVFVTSDGENDIQGRLYADGDSVSVPSLKIGVDNTGNQWAPSVAVFDDGRFIVAWTSGPECSDCPPGPDGDFSAVLAQMYSFEGEKLGDEFQVNTYSGGWQSDPSVATYQNGPFAILWSSYPSNIEPQGQDGSGHGVFGQIFNEDSSKAGGEFQVNSGGSGDQVFGEVTGLLDGRWFATWYNGPSQYSYIVGQYLEANGSKQWAAVGVNTYNYKGQYTPAAATLSDNNVIVVWRSDTAEGSDADIKAQRLDSSGNKVGDEFLVSHPDPEVRQHPSVASSADGSYVVGWKTYTDAGGPDVFVRGYHANGAGNTGIVKANTCIIGAQQFIDVAELADGSFVAVWESPGQNSPCTGIFAQRFDKNGNKLYH